MNNPRCSKVIGMLSAYIENKLSESERLYVEEHFLTCPECRKKFYEMNEIMDNLQFEYERMMNEFNKIETNRMFNINEYEKFQNNISPYVDDELCYEDSLKFRRYLLKSKPARAELSNVYSLRNNIRKSATTFMNKSNINFSKKIIKKLKKENNNSGFYKKKIILISVILSIIAVFTIFIGISYFSMSYAEEIQDKVQKEIIFPDDTDWVTFFFNDKGEALFSYK